MYPQQAISRRLKENIIIMSKHEKPSLRKVSADVATKDK